MIKITDTLIMTPGPTYIHEDVRKAMSERITNPDIDPDFFEFYRDTCIRLQELMETKNQVLILDGEGILGLEAACASLIEKGDRVLCLDNGIYGHGFGDFARIYGAEVTYFKADYDRSIDFNKFKEFIEKNHDFSIATLVYCETPSGITNNIEPICRLLNEYGIITIVDSVSGVGGEILKTDEWKIDIALGGSQKCLSAPPGLTFLSISEKAWNKIINRQSHVIGYYCNLANWKNWYEQKWFPYTQPISDIYGLRKAVDRLLEKKDYIKRHQTIAEAVRKSLTSAGIELYPADGCSNTVTAFKIPEGVSFKQIYDEMLNNHNIMITGSFGFLQDKIVRIGHMGENCYEDKVYLTLKALNETLQKLDVPLNGELHKLFADFIS